MAATLQNPPSSGARSVAAEPARPRSVLSTIGQGLGLLVLGVIVLFLLSLTVGPLLLPYKALTVYSGSMEPLIHTGSVVIDVPVNAQDVKVGDIVTFVRPDNQNELVTHRVIAIESGPQGQQWVTKGDANTTADPWRVTAAGNGWRYNFNLPYIGYVLNWLQQPLGRILFLVVPAAALGLLTLYELWAPRRKPGRG